MIKVKIYELHKHRNETTFRPYLMARDIFREIGIEFTDDDSYDIAWIGQASITDKNLSLDESVSLGVKFLNDVGGDFMIFDGQDSHSLIGTVDVFRLIRIHSSCRCLLFLKNSLLKNASAYAEYSWNGRTYWGDGNYSVPDIDNLIDDIALSGTNWLSTIRPNFFPINFFTKEHDVCALFGCGLTHGREYGIDNYIHYNEHRKLCLTQLDKISGVDIQRLSPGMRLPPEQYYKTMATSKIVVAPFGYGEMAPRDLEAMAYGSILIKPSMDYLKSEPWIYEEGKTYIGCRHDYADLPDKIDYVLSNYDSLRVEMYENCVDLYRKQYGDVTRLPIYMYNVMVEKLSGIISTETV